MKKQTISSGDVIRYRKGNTAIMRVDKMDDLCGYRTYHGTHLYGEKISVPADNCRRVCAQELRLWQRYKNERDNETV